MKKFKLLIANLIISLLNMFSIIYGDSNYMLVCVIALYGVANLLYVRVGTCPLVIVSRSSGIVSFYRLWKYSYRGNYIITTVVYGGYVVLSLLVIFTSL